MIKILWIVIYIITIILVFNLGRVYEGNSAYISGYNNCMKYKNNR